MGNVTMAETCPKCGYAPVQTQECPRCRVVISKYRSYLQRLGEPPAKPGLPSSAPPPGRGVSPPPPPVESGPWPKGSSAGFWIRAAEAAVDSLVLQAVLLPFQLLIVYPTLLAGGNLRGPRVMAVNMSYAVVAIVVSAGYSVWMHGRWGQTLGKIATGVKVVKVDGEPIGYGRALGRWAALSLNLVTLGIGYLMAGLRSDKRALHDLVAGTRVIKVRRPWLEGRPSGFWMRYVAWSLDGYVILIPVALFGVVAAITIPMAARGALPRAAAASVIVTFVAFSVASIVAYGVWMHGKWGQTLGKMALGMKVVRMDGSPLGYGGAFLRWLGSILSGLILTIGYLMAGLRSDKRALHDLIAGSRVTYVR